jgi:predicted alpha/beta superfamily hydrolase
MPLIVCLFALALAVVPTGPAGSAGDALQVVSQGPAEQYAATQFVVHSKAVGRDFLIKVTPPFAPVPAGRRLPAIYVLDSGYELAGPVGWMLGGTSAMSQAWIVSIGDQPKDFPANWRETDFAHVPIAEEGRPRRPAGGAAFEAFLLQELRPFIESRFGADPDQAFLFGHSLGGLFTATVFAEHPGAFRGYLIGSASIRLNPAVLKSVARAATQADGRRVYVAAGGAETARMLSDEKELVAALTGPGSKATVASHVYEGASHLSYYPQVVIDAFPWLLPPSKTAAAP